MKSLNAGALSLISAGLITQVLLLKLEFVGGTKVCLNTSNYNFTYSGDSYLGAYGLGTIAAVRDSAGELTGLEFEIGATSSATMTILLDEADQWQGATVTLYTALVSHDDTNGYTIEDVGTEFVGYGDTFTLRENASSAWLVATCESSHLDMIRGTPMTYSDGDQKTINANDRFFEFVVSQSDTPVVWPAKEWFYK